MTIEITEDGNVLIPKEVLEKSGFRTGDKVEVVSQANGRVVVSKGLSKKSENFAEWLFSCPEKIDDFPLPDRSSDVLEPSAKSIFDDE